MHEPIERNTIDTTDLFDSDAAEQQHLEQLVAEGHIKVDPETGNIIISDYALDLYNLARAVEDQAARVEPLIPFSEAWEGGPDVELSLTYELSGAVDWFREQEPHQAEFYEQCSERLGGLDTPMPPIVVAIPVAVQESPDVLRATLEQYARQDLPADQFEVQLLINGYKGACEVFNERAAGLHQVVESVRLAYPELVIRDFSIGYSLQPPIIGEVRRVLWNSLVFNAAARGTRQDRLLGVSNDADASRISPDYLRRLWQAHVTTGADVVVAKLVWEKPFSPSSWAGKVLRYWGYVDSVRDHNTVTPHTSDANTAISLATYIAVGGFYGDAQVGEMHDLKCRILDHRRQATRRPVVYEPGARLTTSSRRVIEAMALGHSPWEAWNSEILVFSHDDAVRQQADPLVAAEAMAELHWPEWLEEFDDYYIGQNVDDGAKQRRLIEAGRRIIGLSR